MYNGPDPVWDQEFLLDDIPPDVLTMSLTVCNKGKRSKDAEVAELTVEFSNLANGDEVEEWYVLTGVTPVGEWGTVRLRTRYLHDLIMPEEEYSPLKGNHFKNNIFIKRRCHIYFYLSQNYY